MPCSISINSTGSICCLRIFRKRKHVIRSYREMRCRPDNRDDYYTSGLQPEFIPHPLTPLHMERGVTQKRISTIVPINRDDNYYRGSSPIFEFNSGPHPQPSPKGREPACRQTGRKCKKTSHKKTPGFHPGLQIFHPFRVELKNHPTLRAPLLRTGGEIKNLRFF